MLLSSGKVINNSWIRIVIENKNNNIIMLFPLFGFEGGDKEREKYKIKELFYR